MTVNAIVLSFLVVSIVFVVGLVLGYFIGFFVGKSVGEKPAGNKTPNYKTIRMGGVN